MSERHCCITWIELGPELVQIKTDEVESLIKEKSLPRSLFASVIRVLNAMANYCPVCGDCLNPELTPKAKAQHQAALREVAQQVDNTQVSVLDQICRACNGKKMLGIDKNKVPIQCMNCHGEGIKRAKHVAVDPRAKHAQSKVDDLREQSGIGDNPVSIDAKGIEE